MHGSECSGVLTSLHTQTLGLPRLLLELGSADIPNQVPCVWHPWLHVPCLCLPLSPDVPLLFPDPDVPAHATATRSSCPERGAEDGVAAEGAGAGPRGAQIPVRERGALVLCANGRRER